MTGTKKGQLSITNIMFYLIIVVIAVVVTPIMSGAIDDSITTNNITGMNALVMNAIVPVFWLGIIATFFIFISPISAIRQQ
jgi:uncharacterized membrane protein